MYLLQVYKNYKSITVDIIETLLFFKFNYSRPHLSEIVVGGGESKLVHTRTSTFGIIAVESAK